MKTAVKYLSRFSPASKNLPLRIFALLFGAGMVAALLFIPEPAQAIYILSGAVSLVAGIINGALALILNIQGAIINWLINPDIWGTDAFTGNPTVISAWRIMRDFANLGLVLAIVVIAIGFILRLQTYGSQKTLIRLIAAALLVNFSLVIAGVFIETATITSRFLMDGFAMQQTWQILMRSSGVMLLFEPEQRAEGGLWNWLRAMGNRLVNDPGIAAQIGVRTLITTIFAIMMIAALGALIIMLLIRVAHLWVLLILSPIAWLMWIFPKFEDNWNRWWQEFLRWTFFAPIVIFFLAISLAIVGAAETAPGLREAEDELARVFAGVGGGEPLIGTIARFTISIALIVLSMMIAHQMSITFADKGVEWASSAGKWPAFATWRAGVKEGGQRLASGRVGQWAEKTFAGKGFGLGGIADTVKARRARSSKDTDDMMKRFGDLSDGELERISLSRARSLAERVAAARLLSDRGNFNRYTPAQQQTMLSLANDVSREHAMSIVQANPTLAPVYDTNVARTDTELIGRGRPGAPGADSNSRRIMAVASKTPANIAPKFSVADLQNPAVVLGLTLGSFRQIASDADQNKIDAIRGVLGRGTPTMVNYLASATGVPPAEVDSRINRLRSDPPLAAIFL